jgi:hypothetical protein
MLQSMRLPFGTLATAGALFLGGCGDLGSESDDIQQQQLQRSMYGPGQQGLMNQPPEPTAPPREPVPGE